MTNRGENNTQPAQPLLELRRQVEMESTEGRELAASPQSNPICSIVLDEAIPAIVLTWHRYATSVQFRFVHEYLLDLIKRHGVVKVLGDDTNLPTIHVEDQTWIVQDWMPRALKAGLRLAASKSPTSPFGRASVADIASTAPEALEIRRFDDLAEARRWLQCAGSDR